MTSPATVVPGSGTAIVNADVAVLLAFESDPTRDEVWAAVRARSIDDVLAALLPSGRTAPPTFAVAHVEGERVRLFLRGAVSAVVDGEGGTKRFDAADLRTWSEHVVDDWARLELRLVEESPEGATRPHLVVEGVVSASACVRLRADDATAGDDGVSQPAVDELQHELDQSVTADRRSIRGEEAPPPDETVAHEASEPPSRTTPNAPGDALPETASAEASDVTTGGAEPIDHDDTTHGDEYAHMFGNTSHRSVLDAAVDDPHESDVASIDPPSPELITSTPTAVEAVPGDATWSSQTFASSGGGPLAEDGDGPAPLDDAGLQGDHDGNTLSVAEARRLRGKRADMSETSKGGAATVQALVCVDGHANPPFETICATCSARLDGPPKVIPRPSLGVLRFSTGEEVELDRPLIVGRKPDPEGRRFTDIPKKVTLDGVDGLSRSHAVVHLEGWQVRVEDLGSLNHTTVTLLGREPQRLREGEPMLISDGAVINLGGEVECVFDATV